MRCQPAPPISHTAPYLSTREAHPERERTPELTVDKDCEFVPSGLVNGDMSPAYDVADPGNSSRVRGSQGNGRISDVRCLSIFISQIHIYSDGGVCLQPGPLHEQDNREVVARWKARAIPAVEYAVQIQRVPAPTLYPLTDDPANDFHGAPCYSPVWALAAAKYVIAVVLENKTDTGR